MAEFFRVIYKNKKSFVGMIILIFFMCVAIFGPMIFKLDMTVNFDQRYLPISAKHWLGTDYGGRDTFIQLVYGSRDVLTIGFLGGLFSVFIGLIMGMLMGLLGGRTDTILKGITQLFLTIPSFPALLIISSLIMVKDPLTFSLIMASWSWMSLAMAVRGVVKSYKERDFIVICKVMGMKTSHIIFRELLPNMTSFVAMNYIFAVQGCIVGSVGLMMMGLAPYSPTNWGMMLNLAIQQTGGIFNPRGYIYLFSPIICMGLFQTGAIFFANGLDEALNPRLRHG